MQISMDAVGYCLGKAAEIAEQYEMYALSRGQMPRSVDDLRAICCQYLECNVRVLQLNDPAPNDSVLGTYMKFRDEYVIVIQPGMNYCWTRFVLCKELFHVVIDQPEYRITDIEQHLADVDAVFPVEDAEPKPTTEAEVLAEMAAMEFLFPYAHRKVRVCQTPDYLKIAHEFKVPQVMVEMQYCPVNLIGTC